jgi:hypothetical protein
LATEKPRAEAEAEADSKKFDTNGTFHWSGEEKASQSLSVASNITRDINWTIILYKIFFRKKSLTHLLEPFFDWNLAAELVYDCNCAAECVHPHRHLVGIVSPENYQWGFCPVEEMTVVWVGC